MKPCSKFMMVLLGLMLAVVAGAAPQQVEALAEKLLADNAGVRAACNKELGVYIVAMGSADVTGSKAKAKTVARLEALKNIGEYLGSQVSASETATMKSRKDINGVEQTEEFFSSVMQVNVKQALKGVQDLRIIDDDDKITAIVYLTTKSSDKSSELKAAMNALGDEGTVRAVGEANTHQNAVQMALRAAVEQVVGTMVVGATKITDNEKVKNKIFSGAEGFVDTYRVTDELEIAAGWRISIVAKVSKKKILDSYRVYLKTLGDPVFYLDCTSTDSDAEDKQIAARFGQFFRKLGFKISKTPEGADYVIKASGEYRRVKNPLDEDQTFTQYSMIIRVMSKTGEELLSLPNNPRKSAVCINNPERERELCAAKAFKQMEKPVHEAINDMIARMMADHTDKFMNSDE
ncbi:MAG TPA: hypothetical protein DC009_00575 [Porphyromonadaceae bacterium]|nr:hypothetical protein [Porphyromonadaceae bacterium]